MDINLGSIAGGIAELGYTGAYTGSGFYITAVNTNNIIRDGQTAIAVTGSQLDTVTSAIIETDDSAYQVDVTASWSGAVGGASATFNHSRGATPLTTASYQLRLTISDGINTVSQNLTINPASGYQVVELAGTLVLTDPESLFTPYTGPAPVVGDQYLVPLQTTELATILPNADSTAAYDYTALASVPATDSHSIEWWSSNGTSRVWTSGTINISEPLPVTESVLVPAAGTYGPGAEFQFTVNWAVAVTVSGVPRLNLTLGTEVVYANYVSGSGTTALVFSLTVPSGSTHSGGLTVNSLELNGGTIQDANSVNATLTLNNIGSTAGIVVDATSPAMVSITVPANATYTVGEALDFIVNFSESVTPSGTPRLVLSVGGATKYAAYLSQPGTAALRFRYTVAFGDFDSNGITISSLDLNGGTIKDASGNNATLTLVGVPSTAGILVDAAGPTVTFVAGPAAGTYSLTDVLSFTIGFSEVAVVTGTPRVSVNVGGVVVYADYVSGSGTNELLFQHTIAQSGLLDLDGITVSGLELNGGTITDAESNVASLTLQNIGSTVGVLVDTTAPAGTLTQTAVNVVQPALSGTVDDPAATIVVSPGAVSATNNGDGSWSLASGLVGPLVQGSNTVSVTFTDAEGNVATIQQIVVVDSVAPVVVLDDVTVEDSTPTLAGTCDDATAVIEVTIDGITYSTSNVIGGSWAITVTNPLGSGIYTASVTATDPAGNVGIDTAQITITDADAPLVQSVAVPPAGIYVINDTLDITVTFSEPVTVVGSPFIPVQIGGNTRNFAYSAGSGTAAITFSYTVQAGDNDTDGLGVGDINLNAGTIQDSSGNNASLLLGGPTTAGVIIDTEPAVITIDPLTTINTGPTVSGTSSEVSAALTLVVNGVTYHPVVNASTGVWQQTIGTLNPGTYTMTLDAVDVAGNVSTQATANLTIEVPEETSAPGEPDRLTNAITLLKRRLGRYTDNPSNLDAHILDELKAAQERLENKTALPWFLKVRLEGITTTPGVEKVTLPLDFIRLREDWEYPVQLKYDGKWRRLGVYSYDQFWDNTPEEGDVPTSAAQDGPTIVLGPTPTGLYPLRLGYYKKEFVLNPGKVVSNAWLKYAFDLIVSEAGFILANNYLKNQEAAAQFQAEIVRAERDLRMTTIAYETAAMESWELNNDR